jgi:RNA polymerase sigma-70 factor (ECF subfamily)
VSSPASTPPPAGNLKQWIESARQGSQAALGQVLEYCRPYLLAVANEQLESDLQAKAGASDLVQDTFVEASRGFAGFRGRSEEELFTWLRQILLHNLANFRRQFRGTEKRQVHREVSLDRAPAEELLGGLMDEGSSPSEQARARERDAALERALEQLSESHRRVVQWHSLERCSFEVIGQRLNCSAEAARKLWTRAIEKLQHILGPADESG